MPIPRERPQFNEERTTFVADNGRLMRGPYQSTEWSSAPPFEELEAIRDLGFNALHLYAEVFDPNYPAPGSNSPGYASARVDSVVNSTRELGLYLIMTIGNGANNGDHNPEYARDFWEFYAPRYKDETHVIFEIHNEPVAWGPPYLTHTTPTGGLDLQVEAYNVIRSHAPDTPVLLFSYAVMTSTQNVLIDIEAFNEAVYGESDVVWTNKAVAFHGYGGSATAGAVEGLLAAGYPCFMTEFISTPWGGSAEGQDVELTAELERLGVSWLNFLTVPPDGVSPLVTIPRHYRELIEVSGLSWTPDFGDWPVQRGVFGNDGIPPRTTSEFVNNTLTGTLRIEAEDFDLGGQGVAYQVEEDINQTGRYRPDDGVDIVGVPGSRGANAIQANHDGEWLEYTIHVVEAGYYDLTLQYAAPGDAQVRIHYQGTDRTGIWDLPATGGLTSWQEATRQVFLERGQRILRLKIVTGGLNVDWMELTPAAEGPIPNGTYRLVHRETGLAMANDTSNHHVLASPPNQSNAQRWNLTHLGAGQYRVSSVTNNRYWTFGNPIGMVWWWDVASRVQRATVRITDDGYFLFSTAHVGHDLVVTNGQVRNTFHSPESPSLWAILGPGDPLFPYGLAASYASPSQINLSWQAPAGAESYNVMRSTTSGGPYTTIASGVTSPNYADGDLDPETTYYYVVSAVSSAGESLVSSETQAARLHAHLKFDQSRGSSAPDDSGNGWNGSLSNGVVWTEGRFGNAIQLDGNNAHVSLPAGVVSELDDFTLSLWVLASNPINSWSRILDFGTGTENYMFITPRNGINNNVRFAIRIPTTGEQTITGNAPLPTGQWTHIVVTLSGSTGTLYVDGVAVGTNTNMNLRPSDLGETTNNFLGRSQFGWDPYFGGRIDDLRIYDRALTQSLVQELATLPPAPTGVSAVAGPGQVTLSWNASADAVSYSVARATSSGGPFITVADGLVDTDYVDSSLAGGTTYFYVVTAFNGHFAGETSAPVSATPEAAPVDPVESMTPTITVTAGEGFLHLPISVEDRVYQLQHSDHPGGPWENHGEPVIGTGDALQFPIAVDPERPQAFFRIGIAP